MIQFDVRLAFLLFFFSFERNVINKCKCLKVSSVQHFIWFEFKCDSNIIDNVVKWQSQKSLTINLVHFMTRQTDFSFTKMTTFHRNITNDDMSVYFNYELTISFLCVTYKPWKIRAQRKRFRLFLTSSNWIEKITYLFYQKT